MSSIRQKLTSASAVIVLLLVACACSYTPYQAPISGLLPDLSEVPVSAPLPIDGTWTIRELNKRITIDKGRGWAVDSWVHAVVFQIKPNQVVLRNFETLPDGSFIADDLPLRTKVKLTPLANGSILATAQGLIPSTYYLDPVETEKDQVSNDTTKDLPMDSDSTKANPKKSAGKNAAE